MAIKLEEVKKGLCFKGLRKDKKVGKYLVLAASKYRVVFTMINDYTLYSAIDSLIIDSVKDFAGTVAVDMLQFMSIKKFMYTFGQTGVPYVYLSNCQLHKINGAIYDFLDGRIVNASNGSFVYDFDLDTYEAGLSDMSIEQEEVLPKKDETPVVPNTTEENDPSNGTKDKKNNNSDVMIVSNEELILNGITPDVNTTYYNLLYDKKYKHKRKCNQNVLDYNTIKSPYNNDRNIYTYNEVLKIAYMDSAQISATFNVFISNAKIMKRNAMKILGIGTKHEPDRNDWVALFDSGMSVKDIIDLVNADKITAATIRGSYNRWLIDNGLSKTKSKKDVIHKYEKIIADGDMDILNSVYNMGYAELAKKEGCTLSAAADLLSIIRNYVQSTSVCYAIRFTSETLKSANVCHFDTARFVLNKALELEWVYKKYFNVRSNIIAGLETINENISDSDKDFVIAMFKNVSASRNSHKYYTNTQKDVIARPDASTSDYMIAFAIGYNRAYKIKNNINNKRMRSKQ